jgi:type IV secretion system protein VirB6
MSNLGDFVYFQLIYEWISVRIVEFGSQVMNRAMAWVIGIALLLITLWILIQGYRMITGQSRESMMATVANMGKIAAIVAVASSMSLGSDDLQVFFTTDLAESINFLVTGEYERPSHAIDTNLAWTQVAMGAIDAVYVPPNDPATAEIKNRAMLMTTLGTASPAMAAGAMLLLYKVAMALFIGFGPLFILCLMFDQTKELFRRWLMYGLGTLFSMAVLNFMVSLTLELMARVAMALWGHRLAMAAITGESVEGFSTQAMQQGGVGLLMTVLIVSTPPMAAMFFGGTMGNFMFQSAFRDNSAGKESQGAYGRGMQPMNSSQTTASPPTSTGGFGTHSLSPSNSLRTASLDTIKRPG